MLALDEQTRVIVLYFIPVNILPTYERFKVKFPQNRQISNFTRAYKNGLGTIIKLGGAGEGGSPPPENYLGTPKFKFLQNLKWLIPRLPDIHLLFY